jgi:hypothetical protein
VSTSFGEELDVTDPGIGFWLARERNCSRKSVKRSGKIAAELLARAVFQLAKNVPSRFANTTSAIMTGI